VSPTVTSVTRVILPDHAELAVLWGTSDAGGQPNLLVQHLLDTAAVGDLIWARFLAPAVRDAWDSATGGCGRDVFLLLCGLHDVGKATPAFQSKAPALAEAVKSAGLAWPRLGRDEQSNTGLATTVAVRPSEG
jgi:CRISPR-associated endonuclease/helicase Cas3